MSAEQARGQRAPAAASGRGHALPALIGHTARLQLRGMLIWGLALGLYSAMIVATFTTFEDPQQIAALLESYPRGLKEAFNLNSLSSIEGFLDSQVFNLAPLALAFFAILAGANAISGAEERGAMDVLLGNPLPRWQLVVGNFVATAVTLLGVGAVSGLLTWGSAVLLDVDLSPGSTAAAFLNLWAICLLFGGLAMLCSAFVHRRALAIAVPGAVLFAMYLLNTVGNVSQDLEDLRPLSAFYYYGSAIQDGIEWANFGGLTAAALVLVLVAIPIFRRRDIYT